MVTFFNDTNLASSDPALPAMQYFGTKGFFNTHDARPGTPLTAPVARAWLATFEKLLRHDPAFDPTAEARALPAGAAAEAPEISTRDFLALLKPLLSPTAPPPATAFAPDKTITRGEACRLLQAVLFPSP